MIAKSRKASPPVTGRTPSGAGPGPALVRAPAGTSTPRETRSISNVIDFEGYCRERHGLEAIEEARSDPEGLDMFVEPGFEVPPDALPAAPAKPRPYDLRRLAELTAKLGQESGFNLGIDETALEAAFHFAKEQAGRMEIPLEIALEIATRAVLNHERGRCDPALYIIRPF